MRKKRGIKVYDGKRMLLYQGSQSFFMWFSIRPDERIGWLSLLNHLGEMKIWLTGMMEAEKRQSGRYYLKKERGRK